MPGWPAKTSHAMLVRAPDATHVYLGMDLARLGGALKPTVVVTAADLAKINIRVPAFYAGDLFCPVGKTPIYMGQPVALLIFETFDAYDRARLALRDGTFVRFGEETGPVEMPNYGAFRFTRVAGATPDAPDVYSPVLAGWVSPGRVQSSALPVWSSLAPSRRQGLRQGGDLRRPDPRRDHRERGRPRWCSIAPSIRSRSIRCSWSRNAALPGTAQKAKRSNWCSACSRPMRRRNRSRSCSARPRRRSSRAVSTRTSPMSAAASAARTTRRSCSMSRWRRCSSRTARCGWRMIAISSSRAASNATPSRCARGSPSIAQTGKITAFAADHVLDGGGLANFSSNVATVAANAAIGIYDVPKVDVTTVARPHPRRHGGLDARLWHAADHDGARSADRRSGDGVEARSDRRFAAATR